MKYIRRELNKRSGQKRTSFKELFFTQWRKGGTQRIHKISRKDAKAQRIQGFLAAIAEVQRTPLRRVRCERLIAQRRSKISAFVGMLSF